MDPQRFGVFGLTTTREAFGKSTRRRLLVEDVAVTRTSAVKYAKNSLRFLELDYCPKGHIQLKADSFRCTGRRAAGHRLAGVALTDSRISAHVVE